MSSVIGSNWVVDRAAAAYSQPHYGSVTLAAAAKRPSESRPRAPRAPLPRPVTSKTLLIVVYFKLNRRAELLNPGLLHANA